MREGSGTGAGVGTGAGAAREVGAGVGTWVLKTTGVATGAGTTCKNIVRLVRRRFETSRTVGVGLGGSGRARTA